MALSATYDSQLSRIRLAMTGAGGTATKATFDRSIDGVAWTVVRGGTSMPVASNAANVDDYEFPPGVLITYRVRTYTAGDVLVDTFNTTITQDLDSVWLKVPALPFLNRPIVIGDRSDITRRARGGLFDVVGRTNPVHVGDIRSSISYTLEILTSTPAEETDLDHLLASGEVLFIHVPSTVELIRGGYFVADDVKWEPTLRLSNRRVFSLPLTEVAAPGADVVGSTYTWSSVLAEYATWSDVIADNLTWADLLERVASPSEVIVP